MFVGHVKQLVAIEGANRRKLQWFGHTPRRQGTLAQMVMHGMVDWVQERGRPKGKWTNHIAD